jgi:deoxyribonuclease V
MIVCFDVDYRAHEVVAACVGFHDWPDGHAAFERTKRWPGQAASYEPGAFYRREMPYLLELLAELMDPIGTVVVDGYVWLDGGRPGLGAHLHEALQGASAVVGVAKRPFRDATNACALRRGESALPLFISAVGVDLRDATDAVARMHGPYRLPTLLKRVDRLSRT